MKRFPQKLYVALIVFFLYVPILVLVVLSFNKSKSRAKWGGFTFEWYVRMFQNKDIMNALYYTLLIALVSAFVATILGTMLAFGINKMRAVSRSIITGMVNIPMLNAEIVTGISLMLLFIVFRYQLGFTSVLFSHITFNIPYVLLSVSPRLRQFNPSVYEAALDLGAKPFYAFFKVVFPDIFPGILSGFLLSITLSVDDFIITYFTRGAEIQTLSTLIYTMQKRGIQPEIYALSTLLFFAILFLLVVVNVRSNKAQKWYERIGRM